MKYYTIYKITNITNGKYYIGKHITDNPNDGYMGSGKAIKSAIKKYGKEKFIKEILHVCYDEEQMNLLEEMLIDYRDAMSYNMTVGGKGGWNYVNENNLTNLSTHRKIKSEKMKEYWTEERKKEKSRKMKEYNEKNGKERYSAAAKTLHSDPAFKKRFVDVMTEVNKDIEKRAEASIKLKEKWKDPEYKEKMKKRKHGSNSISLKEKWKDPDWRQMMLERRKKKRETNKNN